MKQVVVLGSTGSVGRQALEVMGEHPKLFQAFALTSNTQADVLIEQALRLKPTFVVIADESKYTIVKEALKNIPTEVLAGTGGLSEVVQHTEVDTVLTAVVGYCGLLPTYLAAKKGKTIALANKETMVVAGELIRDTAHKNGAVIIPVDSEHSAIFQCLQGETSDTIEKIILTASGGPFRGRNAAYLQGVTIEQALKHPNWTMGPKITVDSASMMNKGLEVIEAKWLFNLSVSQISVVVHPQSIIHSMVQFVDGSIKAQMGTPSMKLPIQYALAYPHRIKNDYQRYPFSPLQNLTFEEPDSKTFRNLALAFEAMNRGGNMPCILNAANEVVVSGFLEKRIGFLEMSRVIEQCMERITHIEEPTFDDYVATDLETRKFAFDLIV